MLGSRRVAWRRLAGVVVGLALCALVVQDAGAVLVVNRPVDNPDVIVTLASHEWERLPEVVRLAAIYPQARIWLTLPVDPTPITCHDCGTRAATLVRAGVDEQRIEVLVMTRAQKGTYGEALATRERSSRADMHRLLVVTSPYHTRRSLATFREVFAGTSVQVGISPASATSPARPRRWWSTPYDRWYVRYEWAALLYYLGRYGVDPFVG